MRQAFHKYLECGIFAHGFAGARCGDCGHDYFVAFSCKGRGVCPSCNTRRMVETAAHLTDPVFPRLPVRQSLAAKPHLSPGHCNSRDRRGPGASTLRRRILRAFVGRGLLERFEAKEMLGYQHNGISVDAGVRLMT